MKLLIIFTPITMCLIVMGSCLTHDCIGQSREIIEKVSKGDSSRSVFYLPANKRLEDVPWRDSVYRFPSFEPGTVTFSTGYSPQEQVRMNYNLYFMQMDYISSKGDTLQVKPSKELKLISIGDHFFYHDYKEGYLEVIQQLPVALGARHLMVAQYIDHLPGGTYRKPGYAPFSDEDARGAAITLDRYYVKDCDYFFIGTSNEVLNATPASVFRLFREHKNAVRSYLDEHDVDFENREQLMNLLTFCNGLK